MKALTGTTRIIFLGFFASHIPITLLIDSQALFVGGGVNNILSLPQIHPPALQDFVQNYASQMRDPLMSYPFDKIWFNACVFLELLFQVPFFFWAVLQLLQESKKLYYSDRFRTACLLYGSHTATTLVPILATIATNPEATPKESATLFAIYLPYLILPLWLLFLALDPKTGDDESDVGSGQSNKPKEKKHLRKQHGQPSQPEYRAKVA